MKVTVKKLEKLGIDTQTIQWFKRNIGELKVSKIKDIKGDYRGIKGLLNQLFIDKEYNPKDIYRDRLKLPFDHACIPISNIYDENNNLLSYEQDSHRGYVTKWTMTYDSSNNRTSTKASLFSGTADGDNITSFDINNRGQSFNKDSEFIETAIFDSNNNEVGGSRSDCSGKMTWVKTYDSSGNILTYQDSKGFGYKNSYNTNGDLTLKTSTKGLYLYRTYDSLGNVLIYEDKNESYNDEIYDDWGRSLPFDGYKWERIYTKTDKGFIQYLNGEPEIVVMF